MWILSWDYHALTTQPWNLFNANIFHPEPIMLAGAEHMLGYLPLYAPPYALTRNPVLSLAVTIWLSFALSGASMYALLRYWKCRRSAALFGGFVYAYLPGKFLQAFMVQFVGWQYLPLALIFLDRTLDLGRARDAGLFSLFLLLQMLCSFYVAYISLTLLAAYTGTILGWRLLRDRRAIYLRGALLAGSGAAIAGLALGLLALPYLSRAAAGGIADYAQDIALQNMSIRSWWPYLTSPALPGFQASPAFGEAHYLGVLPLCLSLVALLPSRARSYGPGPVRCAGLLVALLVSAVFAMGPDAAFGGISIPPLYDWGVALVPGFSSMRQPARYAYAIGFAVAALGAIGFSRILTRVHAKNWVASLAAAAAIAFTVADFGILRHRHEVREVAIGDEAPEVYQRLAELEPGTVLELPGGLKRDRLNQSLRESEYALYSTVHWNPIINGFTGHQPENVETLFAIAQALPDERAAEALCRITGLKYVIVHSDRLLPIERKWWTSPVGMTLIDRFGTDLLFRVSKPCTDDRHESYLQTTERTETVLGHPLEILPPEDRRAEIRFAGLPPTVAPAEFTLNIPLFVKNRSSRTWPAIAPGSDKAVTLAFRWQALPGGKIARENLAESVLAYDLEPGESVRALVSARVPKESGDYRLTIGLAQAGEWFPERLVLNRIAVRRAIDLMRRGSHPVR